MTVNEHKPANDSRRICAVDVDGRMALSVGGQLVIQHRHGSRVAKLEGFKDFQYLVFENQHNLWALNQTDNTTGRYELLKLVMRT